jgi:hypothetical protein
MQPPTSTICALCVAGEATTREHIPAELFFDRPLPGNLITVPSCAACNHGSQHEDEYLRAFMMLLRGHTPSPAIENVRSRAVRQLDREPRLRAGFQEASELRWEAGPDGPPVVGLVTKPDRERLWKVLTKYARGLHFWSTGTILPIEAPPSIERIFNREPRPADYWEPLLAAAEYARGGTVVTIGVHAEFRYSFRAIDRGDALSAMVLDFYQSFPYVAMMMKPGTDFTKPVRLPF